MLVYAIENLENGKVYVGQTTQDLSKRMAKHKFLLNNGEHTERFQKDWDTFGSDSFDWYILDDTCDNIEDLNKKENEWITKLKVHEEDKGYNIYYDGYVNKLSEDSYRKLNGSYKIPVVKYSLKGKKLKSYESITEACEDVGSSIQNLIVCLQGKTKTAKGFQWKYLTDKTPKKIKPVKSQRERQGKHGSKSVVKYSLDGERLDEYESIKIAGEENNMSGESVSCGAKGRYITAGGFMWRYSEEAPDKLDPAPPLKERKGRCRKEIYQYDLDGNFIKKYNSITEASNQTNIQGVSISKNAKGKYNHAGGYKWFYNKQ